MSVDDVDDADIARRVTHHAQAEAAREAVWAKDQRDWRIAQLATVLLTHSPAYRMVGASPGHIKEAVEVAAEVLAAARSLP